MHAVTIYILLPLKDTVKYHESDGQVFAQVPQARVQILAYQTSDILQYLGHNRFIMYPIIKLITMQWRRLPLKYLRWIVVASKQWIVVASVSLAAVNKPGTAWCWGTYL